MIRLRWPDGSETFGSSFDAVEDAWRRIQWDEYDLAGFRYEIARRATTQDESGFDDEVLLGSSERFLRELARRQWFVVEES
jgi:hypothetical protein